MRVFAFLLLTVATLQAQYYDNYFGANKVNYTIFDWKILETEHFEIYYYPEMRELAERAAGMAEEQYVELQNLFNYSVKSKIPMIIYSSHLHFQQTNVSPFEIPEGVGGFFEFFKGRVVLPSDGSTYHFRRVLRHELVHVFMTSKVNRVLGDHRKLSHPGPPLWFTEGLAEFWSGDPDFQAEMVMRDATLNNTLVPIRQFYRVEGTYYMYKLGENLLHFMAETYGQEKILLLLENIWKSDVFEKVVMATVGKDYETLNDEWVYWLRKRYYPSLSDRDAPGAMANVLTKEGFNTKPAFYRNADRDELYFVSNRDGYTSVYRQVIGQEEVEIVIKGERSHDYETFHFFKSKIDINKKGELAFVTKSGETDVLHIYDVSSRRVTHRYMYANLVGLASPSWSPDGDRLVVSGLSKSGNSDLYLIRVSDGAEDGYIRKITNDFYDDRDPSWSPDGRYIAFSSDRTQNGWQGLYNICVYDLSTDRAYFLTRGPYMDATPAWSPDGRWVMFTSNERGSTTDLWVVPFSNGQSTFVKDIDRTGSSDAPSSHEPKRFLNLTTAAFDPVWINPDEVVFAAFDRFSFRIHHLKGVSRRLAGLDSVSRAVTDWYNVPWTTPRVTITQSNTKPYEKKYGLDFVQGAFQADPVFGSGGGAQLAVTDMLGNDQYYFLIYNTARGTSDLLTDWNFVVTKVNLNQRTSFAYGLFRFKGDFIEIGDGGDIEILDESRYGGFFQASYPLTKFQRLESSISVSRFKREEAPTILPVDGILVSNFLGYTVDNSLWGPSGPLDGSRASLALGYTMDARRSQQNYYTVIADYRHYYRLTLRSAYAFRTMVQWNDGKNPQNFLLGGSWDLRGYPRWSIPGTRFFVINNELRFPFVDALDIKLPFGGFGLRSVRGAVFLDLGSAWGSQITDGSVVLGNEKFDGVVGSVGTGFRLNMWNVLVLRFDFGKMFDLRGYRVGRFRLPGNRDRFITTNFETGGNEGFGGRIDGTLLEKRRWSRGIFFQFWFGVDY